MVSKYVLKEDEAKHIHPRKTWAIGLSIEVGDEIENDGCVFPAKKAHIATAELEPTADIAVGETGPQGPAGAASTVPGPKGDPGGVAGHWSPQETPTGDQDGSNQSFTALNTPTSVVIVWLNGQRMTWGDDYTNIGATVTLITFAPRDAAHGGTDKFYLEYYYA